MARYLDKLTLNNTVLQKGSTLTLNKSDDSFGIALTAPSGLSANYTFSLPTSGGASGQVLSTDGTGAASYVDVALQGGNTLAAALSLGTNDSNAFNLKTNGVNRLIVGATGDLDFRGDGTIARSLKFEQKDNTAAVSVKAPNTGVTSWTMTLPATAGSANQTLQTNGVGVTSWADTILQLGNAFGADIVIGSSDAFATIVQTNSVNRVKVTTAGDVQLLGDTTNARKLQFQQKDNAAAVSFKAPDTGVTSYTLTWPAVQATASGQTFVNDGAGNLVWGEPEPSQVVQYSVLAVSGDTTLDLLHNVIEVDATAGNVVLTLPAVSTGKGMTYFVYKVDASANTVQIVPASGEKYNNIVDNATIFLNNQYDRTYTIGITGGWWTF